MKFKIAQGEFNKVLQAVNKSVLSRPNLPVLANILISAAGGKLEVVSTDLETATKAIVDCEVEKEGKVTVPGRLLWEFVSQIGEDELTIEKLNEEVVVSAKKYSARLATMPPGDFPAIPKIEKGQTIGVVAVDLVRSVNKVGFCAAQDEGRPILTGVLCEINKTALTMVATDGYRLSYQEIAVQRKASAALKFVVPAKALVEMTKIIAEQDVSSANIEMEVADALNQVNFKMGNVEFTSRLIEGEFPNWQKIIPTDFSSVAKISKEEFIKVIRIASIFARDSGSIIRLKFESNGAKGARLVVFANNAQVGSNEAEAEVELKGKGGEIAFNFRYLLEMLSSIEGEEVGFEMIESLNPGRLTVPGDKNYFHIVMPVRLQS